MALKITEELLSELEVAFTDNSPETSWYLDRKTGDIHFYMDPSWVGDDIEYPDFESDRFIYIEPQETWVGYGDMEAFIATVTDRQLRGRLEASIRGRGAFRRFRDTLGLDERQRERWFEFERARVRARIHDWLEYHELAEAPE